MFPKCGLLVFLLLMAATLPSLVLSKATHCQNWKSDEYRCAKDHYGGDHIRVANKDAIGVRFKVGYWMSRCGQHRQNYDNKEYTLAGFEVRYITFGGVGSGYCNEFYVYQCSTLENHNYLNCRSILNVSPER